MTWLTWLWPAPRDLSRAWLKEINRPSSRIEFHGVVPKWPIKKLLNENALWNTNKLRKSA